MRWGRSGGRGHFPCRCMWAAATTKKERACDYFATASPAPTVCRSATFFGGGQVSTRLASALPNPSLESFAVWASRFPPEACTVSVKSNCGSDISDWMPSLFIRRPQISNPCNLAGGDLKYCAAEAPFEIDSEGKTEEVSTGRCTSSSN